ncbi:GNAT family N-acetyltransferase [Candidatus Halobonum tyrrellensis]|uniref:GCN5-related N-acetyltransferase n=1 Tax=Candidatus Halobonum tyrrellensis G22 TaxID=1324957 RepID=V4HF36_9EURY|nr:GNAT family N-acetyltransferase [Candidatus Halobonum tyrrellensis]ESP88723.1 GCN5-related N-acetyltransferase [Candidatus Halobonum tyrrellensis G22]
MYVRDAKNRDEVWLLDRIEEMGLDEASFRSRDYVIAVDEETNERAGFGRVRVHKPDDADEFCELTSIGVVGAWRGQGVGAHVVERLVTEAGDDGFESVYCFTDLPTYLAQFGFERVDADDLSVPVRERFEAVGGDDDATVPLRVAVEGFEMPTRLRERFKTAAPAGDGEGGIEESAEDFGIDPDEATYKYDTGR